MLSNELDENQSDYNFVQLNHTIEADIAQLFGIRNNYIAIWGFSQLWYDDKITNQFVAWEALKMG